VLASIVGPDILIVIAIVLVLFGGTQIPKLARSFGSAKTEFQRGQDEAKASVTVPVEVVVHADKP
jgi:sec-independent protein translocase protein TatA